MASRLKGLSSVFCTLAFTALTAISCSGKIAPKVDKSYLEGTWASQDVRYTFTRDSVLIEDSVEGFSYPYEIAGNKRTIRYTDPFGETDTFDIEPINDTQIWICLDGKQRFCFKKE